MNTTTEWSYVLASSADEYCHLIDQLDQASGDWLDNLASLLPRIHAAVSALEDTCVDKVPQEPGQDMDRRFELYTRLRKLLGDHDGYALDFDKPEELDDMSGSLADDFTDIYFDLKKGLNLLEKDPEALSHALGLWHRSYLWHWGQHLVDAEKHLYDLQVHHHIGANRSPV